MTPASSLLTGSLPVGAHDAAPSCAACACNCISDPNGDDPNNNAVAKSGGDHAAPSTSRRRTLEEKPDIVEPVPATDRRKQIEVVGETRVVEGTISEPGFVDNLDGNRLDDVEAGSAPIPVAAVAAAAAAAAAEGMAAPSASWPGVMLPPPPPPMPYDADVGRDVRQALADWMSSPPQLQAPNPRPATPPPPQAPNPPRPVSPQQQQQQQAPNPPPARPVSALAAALARMEAERQAAVRAASQAEMQREFNGLRAPNAAPAPAPVHEAASSAPSPQIRRSGRRRHHSRSRDVDAVAIAVASAAQRMVAAPPLPPPVAAPSHDHCLRNFSCDLPQAFPHKLGCHRYQSPNVLHSALHYAYVAVYCVLYLLVSIIRWTLILIFLTDYPCLHIKLGLLLALLGGVLFYVLQFDTPDEPVIALGKTRAARSAVYEANGTLGDDGFEDFPEAAKRALRAYHQLVAAGDYDNDEYYDGDGEEYYDYGEYEVVPAVAYYKVAGLRERRVRED